MRKRRIALAVASFAGAAALALGTVAASSHVRGSGAGASAQRTAVLTGTTTSEKNGQLLVPVHKTLLEVLREDMQLTGTKHGCAR